MTLALLFPGQGSQHVGMGRDLADAHEIARDTFREADDVLGYALTRIMWEGPEDELTETRHAQLAILTHSVATHRTVRERLGPVAFAAGHSLGEFSAHVAAGTLGFRDALEAVRVRGELMFSSGRERPGTMAAILGLSDETVQALCESVTAGTCVPANFNSDGQIVISGDRRAVAEALERAREAGAKRVVELNVSGAFHSPLMEPARADFEAKLAQLDFRDPDHPVVSNVTAGPVTRGEEARGLLVRQLTSPVRWRASVATMMEAGADRFVELGPSSVLCGLNRRIARRVPCTAIGTADDVNGFTPTGG